MKFVLCTMKFLRKISLQICCVLLLVSVTAKEAAWLFSSQSEAIEIIENAENTPDNSSESETEHQKSKSSKRENIQESEVFFKHFLTTTIAAVPESSRRTAYHFQANVNDAPSRRVIAPPPEQI